jgi:hypothetical protein
MPVLSDSEILDLVTTTLRDLGPPRFQQIAQQLQDYEVMSKWLKGDKVQIDSGYGIQRTLMVGLAGSAAHVGLYETDDVDVKDLLTNMTVPWRHARTFWAFERREMLMNSGKALVTKLIEPRRAGATIDMAQELEDKAWAAPDASDTKYPYGIPYWITCNSTAGFNGTVSYGHTTKGGVNPTQFSAVKNYSGTYTTVSKSDLIKKLRTAKRKTGWKSPVSIQDYRGGKADQYRLYVNETTMSSFEDVGESQNENLGRDVASIDETIVFRKHPIIYVPKLDSHSIKTTANAAVTNPVYMVDHSTFFPVVLKGDFLRESDTMIVPGQHNVYTTFTDLTYNFICIDCRRQAVLYVA